MDCSPPGSTVHRILQARITGVGCHALLQGIFLTQGLNPGLLHCREVLDVWATREAPGGPQWHINQFSPQASSYLQAFTMWFPPLLPVPGPGEVETWEGSQLQSEDGEALPHSDSCRTITTWPESSFLECLISSEMASSGADTEGQRIKVSTSQGDQHPPINAFSSRGRVGLHGHGILLRTCSCH